ncbi:hypothetical protein CYMTET_41810 [Cymbomonas tetramitiformis]|uniref:AP2/ERF domain-containing protein n=1 Tax=Cymbomonas tetramitiformis TaxID=36881 RepID=A0AAE0C6S7_9CHLO|nr:hypothetical protein CYMTET_41810 [Cymbomonas tetramitiformis]
MGKLLRSLCVKVVLTWSTWWQWGQLAMAHPSAKAVAGWEQNWVGPRPGVIWDKRRKRWRVELTVDSCCCHVGYFDDEESAAEAYDRASRELRGADIHEGNFPGSPRRHADEEVIGAPEPHGNHDQGAVTRQPPPDVQAVKNEGRAEGPSQERDPVIGQRVLCWWDKYGWCAGTIVSCGKASKEYKVFRASSFTRP